ncbi:MAG: PH domain-containing protein [Candidatus Aenigmatarchaeota archaeon]
MAEKTYLVFHPTRLAFIKLYILFLIFIVTGAALLLSMFGLLPFDVPLPEEYSLYAAAVSIVIGIVLLIVAEIKHRIDTYIMTNYRIIERRGIVSIKEDSVEWNNIANYTFTQSFLEKLLNIGTIRLYSSGGVEHEAEVLIKKTPHIKKIRFLLDKLIQRG